MLRLEIIKDALKEKVTPMGYFSSHEMFGLALTDRVGNMYLLGKQGQGKTTHLVGILASDIYHSRGGLVIDPFGDIIDQVARFVSPDQVGSFAEFAVEPDTVKANIERFESEIDLAALKDDSSKMLLCRLAYPVVGAAQAREIGLHILKRYYEVVGREVDLGGRTLLIDEAHNFIDDELLEEVLISRDYHLSCVLSDQTANEYALTVSRQIFAGLDHLICYQTGRLTAELLIEACQLQATLKELTGLQQYHYYASFNRKLDEQPEIQAKGIYPIVYPEARQDLRFK